jgi:phosphoenolpyruvate carboxykinase (GTP)
VNNVFSFIDSIALGFVSQDVPGATPKKPASGLIARKDEDGKFLWPGFRDNMRVLRWIVERSSGQGKAHEGRLGWVPYKEDLDWSGLEFNDEDWSKLMSIDPEKLRMQTLRHEELFLQLSESLPKEMLFERELLVSRL